MNLMERLRRSKTSLLYRIAPAYTVKKRWQEDGRHYSERKIDRAYELMYDYISDLCLNEKPHKILEYGCGYGYLLKKIYERNRDGDRSNIEFYGIDYSESQIENAKAYFKYGKFYSRDITKQNREFGNEAFDTVVGVGVLMYIQPNSINRAMAELHRICGKKIFIAEYYYKYLPEDKKEEYRSVRNDDGRRIYDYADLLKKGGFRNIHVKPIKYFMDKVINDDNAMPLVLIMGEK